MSLLNKVMLNAFLLVVCCLLTMSVAAQSEEVPLKGLLKANLINPGIEWQRPIGYRHLLSINVGFGYNLSYPELTTGFKSGINTLIAPFLDVQDRLYVNRKRMMRKGKNVHNNSGSFLASRFLLRGAAIESSFNRTTDVDMAIGFGYGFQKSKKKFNFAFTICSMVYFDTIGNWGFFPFFPELSFGYNIN